jgi:hypothetical protein
MKIPKKTVPVVPPSTMSTIRFEMGLELLSELDTASLMSLLEKAEPGRAMGEGEGAALVGILGSALRGRLLRRLSAVALATEDELDQADDDPKVMQELVRLRGRASFKDNFQAVKGFFSKLGISDLGTLASFVGPMAKAPGAIIGTPLPGPSPSED